MKTKNLLPAVLFLLTVIFIFPTFSFAQGTWTQKTNFPGTRYCAAGFSIGTKGYIGIGYSGVGTATTVFADFWEWDQTTNVWTKKANYPGASGGMVASFSIGTKGYIATGQKNTGNGFTNELWEYDPALDNWTQKASLPSTPNPPRAWAVGFSIGTKGYVGTGSIDNDGTSPDHVYQDFWEWDQTTNVWTRKADFGGGPRSYAVGFAIGNKGYIGTGEYIYGSGGNKITIDTKDFWEWDQATNIWTRKADFGGTARGYAKGFSIGTKGYIAMGMDTSFTAANDLWEWDPTTNIWVQKANFGGTVRAQAVGFSIADKGYIGTGINDTTCFQDFWEYAPSGNAGIAEVATENFSIYPNPASDIITLKMDNTINTDLKLDIYNVMGTLVKSEPLKQNHQQINIGDLCNGVYMVTINSKDITENLKLIIKR
jgi:hypothetical protein